MAVGVEKDDEGEFAVSHPQVGAVYGYGPGDQARPQRWRRHIVQVQVNQDPYLANAVGDSAGAGRWGDTGEEVRCGVTSR
ncbi:hypothetical protein [Rhodococcus sp. LB1]|uniref:hypothetical protein n=1 Tax=Rhodococcus sp. LB1 TaxID=1807499 RepID=UPI00077A9CF3|nr:hypothetical protein [Rhodococcus sp. LB1]KXX54222.1 hypothetical protein AZG88_25190 [Rhodococcus sp. LB1]